MFIEYCISLYDLERLGYIVEVIEDTEKGLSIVGDVQKSRKSISRQDFDNLLYQLGMDSRHGYILSDICEHKALDDNIVNFRRIVGVERNDKKWLASEHASYEAKMSSSKMKDMGFVIKRMGK